MINWVRLEWKKLRNARQTHTICNQFLTDFNGMQFNLLRMIFYFIYDVDQINTIIKAVNRICNVQHQTFALNVCINIHYVCNSINLHVNCNCQRILSDCARKFSNYLIQKPKQIKHEKTMWHYLFVGAKVSHICKCNFNATRKKEQQNENVYSKKMGPFNWKSLSQRERLAHCQQLLQWQETIHLIYKFEL